jgi:hypothetical protein
MAIYGKSPGIQTGNIIHTTNDYDTFISVSEDCPVEKAEVPPAKEPKSAAQIEYEMVAAHPYTYSSDDVIYAANGERRGIAREEFFSKGQACFRASPLTKRYGWGAHYGRDGKIAIYPRESAEYQKFAADKNLKQLKGMRSTRN